MKISIITAIKNGFPNFIKTYDSVIKQSFSDFEWIVVDDKSELIQYDLLKGCLTDSRVKFISNTHNTGPGGARNSGLEIVTGDFITFIDSDDLWDVDFLKIMSAKIIDSKFGVVFSGYERYIENKGSFLKPFIPHREVVHLDLYSGNDISCLTLMAKTQLVSSDIRFGDYPARNDLVFFIRLLKISGGASPIEKSLATYRLGKNTVSSNKFKALYYQYEVCRELGRFSRFSSIYKVIRWVLYGVKKYYL